MADTVAVSGLEVVGRAGQRRVRAPAPVPHTERLSPFALLAGLRRNPLETWGVWHFEQPIVSGPSVMGHLTVVSDPGGVRRILVDAVDNYPKDPLQLKVLRPGLGDGLLTAEGEAWRRTRRTLAPLFTPRAVAAQASVMHARATALVPQLMAEAARGPVDMVAATTRVTFDILSGTLFSDAPGMDFTRFVAAVTRYFETQGRLSPLDALGAPDWIPRLGRLRAEPAIRTFARLVDRLVRQRRAALAAGDGPEDDLLSRLIRAADPDTGEGLSEAELAANLVTFIGAGHETTANALAWILFLLARQPETLEVVLAEVDRLDVAAPERWIDEAPWLRASLEEAMRLYPPAATLTRTARAADRIGGIAIPRGSLVIVSPYVLQRHRLLWSAPDHFLPERFLPGARESIDRFAYIPFGAGPRVCIGQRFSLVEMGIVLGVWLRAFRPALPPGTVVRPRQAVTLRPHPGLKLALSPRDH